MRCPCIGIRRVCICRISKRNGAIIEKIQLVFTRKLFRRNFNRSPAPCYAERLKLFSLERLSTRILKRNMITMYKIKIGLIRTRSLNLRYSTHHTNRFLIPSTSSALFRNSFVIRHQIIWNKYIGDRTFNSVPSLRKFLEGLSFDWTYIFVDCSRF